MKSQGLFKGYFIITADVQVHKSKIPYSGEHSTYQSVSTDFGKKRESSSCMNYRFMTVVHNTYMLMLTRVQNPFFSYRLYTEIMFYFGKRKVQNI